MSATPKNKLLLHLAYASNVVCGTLLCASLVTTIDAVRLRQRAQDQLDNNPRLTEAQASNMQTVINDSTRLAKSELKSLYVYFPLFGLSLLGTIAARCKYKGVPIHEW